MSMLRKNVAGQRWVVYAWNITTDALVTGDAANITAKLSKDGAALAATDDVNPTELESGYYAFDLTQAETNADELDLIAVSATGNIQVRAVPETRITDARLATTIAAFALTASRSAGLAPASRPMGEQV